MSNRVDGIDGIDATEIVGKNIRCCLPALSILVAKPTRTRR